MLANLTGWHALLILAIVLLVFGSAKLPALARSVGQSMRILKDEVREDETHRNATAAAPEGSAAAAAPAPGRPTGAATWADAERRAS